MQNWHRHKFVWLVIVTLIIICLVHLHHGDRHSYGSEANNLHTIAVTGHGEVFATANIATFSFTASDREATAPDAQSKMAAKANAAIAYLKQNGVDSKDIQTADYNVNPTYADNSPGICSYGKCPPNGTPTINGYEVSETITVKLRDPAKSGTILQGVGNAGVSNISGLSFTIDNPKALQDQARKVAIDDAKAKAKLLAKDLDIRLDDIVSFSENGNFPGPTPYLKEIADQTSASAPVAPDIQTGQNKITSDVILTYEIR